METCVTWLHWAPALAIMVVSEIGEQWSPHTAPAIHAETQITPMGFPRGNTARVMGIKIPKVPQEVPVANASKTPITNTIAGKNDWKLPAEFCTSSSTNCLAPRESVIAFRLQANVRINIAGTMDLNPSGMASAIPSNVIFLRIQ